MLSTLNFESYFCMDASTRALRPTMPPSSAYAKPTVFHDVPVATPAADASGDRALLGGAHNRPEAMIDFDLAIALIAPVHSQIRFDDLPELKDLPEHPSLQSQDHVSGIKHPEALFTAIPRKRRSAPQRSAPATWKLPAGLGGGRLHHRSRAPYAPIHLTRQEVDAAVKAVAQNANFLNRRAVGAYLRNAGCAVANETISKAIRAYRTTHEIAKRSKRVSDEALQAAVVQQLEQRPKVTIAKVQAALRSGGLATNISRVSKMVQKMRALTANHTAQESRTVTL